MMGCRLSEMDYQTLIDEYEEIQKSLVVPWERYSIDLRAEAWVEDDRCQPKILSGMS